MSKYFFIDSANFHCPMFVWLKSSNLWREKIKFQTLYSKSNSLTYYNFSENASTSQLYRRQRKVSQFWIETIKKLASELFSKMGGTRQSWKNSADFGIKMLSFTLGLLFCWFLELKSSYFCTKVQQKWNYFVGGRRRSIYFLRLLRSLRQATPPV